MSKDDKITIEWLPDRNKSETLREQIFDFIKDNITSGNWSAGERLPSQRVLANQFCVNRSTVDEAIGELIADGLLFAKVGSGTFVSDNAHLLDLPCWSEYIAKDSYFQNGALQQHDTALFSNAEYIDFTCNAPPRISLSQDPMKYDFFPTMEDIPFSHTQDPLGLSKLRAALASRLGRLKILAEPKNILITTGSLQSLYLISASLIGKNTGLICETPKAADSLKTFESVGARIMEVPMNNKGLDLFYIRQKIKKTQDRYTVYTMPNFQHPTGTLMSEERRNALFAYCKKHRILIIEDDSRGELWLDQKPPLPIKSQDTSGMVLYTGTISQTFFPELKIGWIVGPEAVIKQLCNLKMQIDGISPLLPQILLQEMFASGYYDKYAEKMRIELKKTRGVMLRSLDEYLSEIAEWEIPPGGFQVWLKLKKRINHNQLLHEALQEGILLRPEDFYSGGQRCLGLSYSNINTADIRYGVKKLKTIIDALHSGSEGRPLLRSFR